MRCCRARVLARPGRIMAQCWRVAHRRGSTAQKRSQSAHAIGEAILARRKAPAHEAVAFRPEGAAGSQTEPGLTYQLLAEVEAVADSGDAKKDIHRAFRRRRF